jgi:hypothetical protein
MKLQSIQQIDGQSFHEFLPVMIVAKNGRFIDAPDHNMMKGACVV